VGAASLPLGRLNNEITKRDERNIRNLKEGIFGQGSSVNRSLYSLPLIPCVVSSMRCRYDEDTAGDQ
jgi:hypothetical protein